MNVNRNFEHEDLIDLGAASVETKGTVGIPEDQAGGLNPTGGLSNE